MKEPQSPDQWQEAVDGAKAALNLVSARSYGIIVGGPTVNIQRCWDIIRSGERRGITPRGAAVERFVFSLIETGRF